MHIFRAGIQHFVDISNVNKISEWLRRRPQSQGYMLVAWLVVCLFISLFKHDLNLKRGGFSYLSSIWFLVGNACIIYLQKLKLESQNFEKNFFLRKSSNFYALKYNFTTEKECFPLHNLNLKSPTRGPRSSHMSN